MKATVSRNEKTGHVRFLNLAIAVIHPSPENDQLYRPVDEDDPEVQALAESIRQHGVREPLVITEDYYVLSGHRRYVAAGLAGLSTVPCRVEPVRRGDPEFLTLLREFNRQRVKSMDEVVREEIICTNPEEAYRVLVEHRQQQARVEVPTITIVGHKKRSAISEAKAPMLAAINSILDQLREYWPLTDRQIHYPLLNDPPLIHAKKEHRYANTLNCYKQLTDLLTRARLEGIIPWDAIHDPTRPVEVWNFHRQPATFVREHLDRFLKGYYRDLQQSQPNHIEIVGEKITIQNMIRPLAMEYCINYTIGRGQCSSPPRRDLAEQFLKSGKQKLIALMLSDFDPDGEEIAHAFCRSMRDDFGIADIVPVKVALTDDQVRAMRLPPRMQAKEGSSNYRKFVDKFGTDVYELEAIPPQRLQQILREAIDSVLDVDAYNAEIEAEKRDAAQLDAIRPVVVGRMGEVAL